MSFLKGKFRRSRSCDGQTQSGDRGRLRTSEGESLGGGSPLTMVQSLGEYVRLDKSESEIKRLKADSKLKAAQMVLVVMGPTGAGKSRFIKEATQMDVNVGDSLFSSTTQVEAYHFQYQKQSIALVDTPGFDDTTRPDAAVFRELAAWLAARYQEKTRLTAIIYMQPITHTRMQGSLLRNFSVMLRMIGIQNAPYLTMVTSMWDIVEPVAGAARELSLRQNFWGSVIASGASIGRFRGDQSSALSILDTIKKQENVVLAIQQEIVDQELTLDQTAAGNYLEKEILTLIGQVTQQPFEMEDLKRALAQAGERRELKASWDPDYGSLWLQNDSPPNLNWNPAIYSPLAPGKFRLIELKAGKDSSPLEISLTIESLANPPKFGAVSYVVGQNNPMVPIDFRYGRSIYQREISKNLYTALRCLRKRSKDISLWVDALSIDQDNPLERAEQVRAMSRIFSQAQNVCIWLGSTESDIGGTVNQFEPRDLISLSLAQTNGVAMNLAHAILDLDDLDSIINKPEKARDFICLLKLMGSPWFRRRWCVQEILLARAATVHCGAHVMSWLDFVDVIQLVNSRWSQISSSLNNIADNFTLGDAHLIGAVALIDASRSIARLGSDSIITERFMNLECLLDTLAMFEVTVPHDAIYSLYDLASNLVGTNKLRIDYRLEPRELFCDVVELIIVESGSSDILCRPWAPLTGLPSWIRTATTSRYRRRRDSFQYDRQHGAPLVNAPRGPKHYQACGQLSAHRNVSFRREIQPILSIRSLVLGTVDSLASECLNGAISQQWLELCGWTDVTKQNAPDAFWCTLVAGMTNDSNKAPRWYKRACEKAFRSSLTDNVDVQRVQGFCRSANVEEYLERVLDVTWSRRLSQVKLHSRYSRLANQPKGQTICLCPKNTKERDILCILHGCSVPVIVRRQERYYVLIGSRSYLMSASQRPDRRDIKSAQFKEVARSKSGFQLQ